MISVVQKKQSFPNLKSRRGSRWLLLSIDVGRICVLKNCNIDLTDRVNLFCFCCSADSHDFCAQYTHTLSVFTVIKLTTDKENERTHIWDARPNVVNPCFQSAETPCQHVVIFGPVLGTGQSLQTLPASGPKVGS